MASICWHMDDSPKATERDKRNYPPDGLYWFMDGVNLAGEPDYLVCTCTDACRDTCSGERDCPGECEACHYVRLRIEEEALIQGSGRSKN